MCGNIPKRDWTSGIFNHGQHGSTSQFGDHDHNRLPKLWTGHNFM